MLSHNREYHLFNKLLGINIHNNTVKALDCALGEKGSPYTRTVSVKHNAYYNTVNTIPYPLFY